MRIGRKFTQTTTLPSRAALALAGRSVVVVGESEQPSAWPDETTTGATSAVGDLTVMSGLITINTPGTTLQNFYLNGRIRVQAANVTIRNFIIHFTGFDQEQGILATNASVSNLLIEDGEIYSDMVNTARMTIALYGSNWTARRLHVHHSWADAFRPVNNCTLEDSYVHDLGDVASVQHADAVQMLIGSNFTATGNNFDIPNLSEPEDKPPGSFMNSAGFMIQSYNGNVSNVLIENNRINGGDYGVQFTERAELGYAISNGRVRNNTFGSEYLYGPWATNVVTNASELCGNVWEDTGLYISGNSACAV